MLLAGIMIGEELFLLKSLRGLFYYILRDYFSFVDKLQAQSDQNWELTLLSMGYKNNPKLKEWPGNND